MSSWDHTDLEAIDAVGEIDVAGYRTDGSLRTPRIVWHVVVEGALFIRSVRGAAGAWYRGAIRTGTGVIDGGGVRAEVAFTPDHGHDREIDDAYRAKYGSGASVRAITSPTAAATTLRVEPR